MQNDREQDPTSQNQDTRVIFGQLLRQRREEVELSGYRLAKLTGIANSTLVDIEKGRRPPSERNLRALAKVSQLDVSYEELKAWADLRRIGGLTSVKRIRSVLPQERRQQDLTNLVNYFKGYMSQLVASLDSPLARLETAACWAIIRSYERLLEEDLTGEGLLTQEEERSLVQFMDKNFTPGDLRTGDYDEAAVIALTRRVSQMLQRIGAQLENPEQL